MNVVIACGGTGGHLFPGLAVAEVLRKRGHEVLVFISEKEIDTLAVTNHSDFRFEKLPTVALPSPFSPAILKFVRRFNHSLALCRSIYRKFQPQIVLGMGGFTSTAPVLAGRMRGAATFPPDSNAFPGQPKPHTPRMPPRRPPHRRLRRTGPHARNPTQQPALRLRRAGRPAPLVILHPRAGTP